MVLVSVVLVPILAGIVLGLLVIFSIENPGPGLVMWAVIYLFFTNLDNPIVQFAVKAIMFLILLGIAFLIAGFVRGFIGAIIEDITGTAGEEDPLEPFPNQDPAPNPDPQQGRDNNTANTGETTTDRVEDVQPDLGPLNHD